MQPKIRSRGAAVVLVACLGAASVALAEPPPTPTRPDAGALMQQIEQGQQQALPKAQKPSLAPQPEMQPKAGLSVTVTRFEFVGNTLLAEPVLQAAVAPWLNRPLDFNELRKAAAAAAEAYRAAGWIVRAYLPEQDIQGGVVRIRILEAVFGAVQLEGAEALHVRPDLIRDYVLAAQTPGQPLSADAIDRALLLIDDLPGVGVTGNLKAGAAEGQTDLVLVLKPMPAVSGSVSADNTGARSTGADRLAGSLAGNSLLGLADRASADLIHTEGSDYLRGGWNVPLGSRGLRAGLSYSHLQYRVISPEFAALDLKGSSSNTGLDASYPLLRGRARNVFLSLGLEHKTYDNDSGDTSISHYKIDLATVGVAANRFDSVGGGGANSGSLQLSTGKVNLDGSANQAADAAGPRTQGSFTKVRYALSRSQVLGLNGSVTAAVNGQLASRNLDSGERLYLGGASGVRAYPANEAGGADGTLFNLDARYRLPRNFTASAFYDWGEVKVNHDNDFAGAAARNNLTLQGAGVGLAWVGSNGLNVRATWSHRLGHNPNPTAAGMDQDGSLDLNRLWFMATFPF